jgi:phosphoglycolate/pyridoxal phosphate phosphatase family enzyme
MEVAMSGEPLRMVAFDIDGVVVRGGAVLPGARQALEEVTRRGLLLRFVTNNSTRHRSEIAQRLAGLGLPVTADLVLTSAAATARWLSSEADPGAVVLVVGGAGLVRELAEVGLDSVPVREWVAARKRVGGPTGSAATAGPPAAVVVGLDREFDYDALTAAQQAILAGALFVATNTDATFPVEGAVLPGGGAIVAAVATATGREPVVIGKPEPRLAQALVEAVGASPRSILFIGDRLETDIEMARRAGMRSALVLTGVTKGSDLGGPGAPMPDHVLETLEELPGLLDNLGARPSLR